MSAAQSDSRPTATDLVAALERHYTGGASGHRDEDSHATYTEVPHGPDGAGRRVDFLAVSLWGSRGHRIEGHEIKVSRADWLAELAQPDKAERWWSATSRWWLVVPDPSIVKSGELPPGWGLMTPPTGKNSRSMKVVERASERDIDPPLWLLARLLLTDKRAAAEVRREIEYATERKVREQERETRERERLTDEDREAMSAARVLTRHLGSAADLIALSNSLSPWELGQALAFVQAERRKPTRHDQIDLERRARQAEEYAARLRDAAKFAEVSA